MYTLNNIITRYIYINKLVSIHAFYSLTDYLCGCVRHGKTLIKNGRQSSFRLLSSNRIITSTLHFAISILHYYIRTYYWKLFILQVFAWSSAARITRDATDDATKSLNDLLDSVKTGFDDLVKTVQVLFISLGIPDMIRQFQWPIISCNFIIIRISLIWLYT